MSVPTPTDVSYGCVAGRIVDIIGDTSSDVGDEPDAIPVSGKISFQPDTKTRKVVSPYKAIAQNRTVECTLDPATGIMQDAEARAYVKLVVGTYTVNFSLASGTINPFVIEVTTAHTEAAPLQLSEAVPYVPPPGSTVQVVQVPPGGADGKTLIWDDGAFAWADPIAGPAGTNGTNGADGPPNVLTIGTVTEGPAAASITGTSPAQVLNLVVPAGPQGPPGIMPGTTYVAPSGDTTGATDLAAINSAITTAKNAGGGTVVLVGAYYVNSPILLDTGVWLAGQGWERTVIHLAAAANSAVVALVGGSGSTSRNYGIRDLTIDGHKESQTAGVAGIDFRGSLTGGQYANCAFGWALRVRVQYTWGHGIWSSHVENRTEQCFSYRCGTAATHNGMKFDGSDQWILNCTNGESFGDGIALTGGSHRMIGSKSWWSGYQNNNRSAGTVKTGNKVNDSNNFTISARNQLVSACEAQDASAAGWLISCTHSQIDGTADISGSTHVILRDAKDCQIRMNIGDGSNHGTTPSLINIWNTNTQRNHVTLNYSNVTTDGANNGTIGGVAGGGAASGWNTILVGPQNVTSAVTYAATITPDPFLWGIETTLTGNVTIANPATDRRAHGTEFEVVLTQDAIGSRTVTWGADYAATSPINTAAGAVTRWRFRNVKTKWVQVLCTPA